MKPVKVNRPPSYGIFNSLCRLLKRQRTAFSFLLFVLLQVTPASAQEECEEVLVLLEVAHIGNMQLPSIICGEEIYLSVPGIFSFIKIKNNTSQDLTSMEGFFIHQQHQFLIDETQKQITYKGKIFPINAEDLIRTKTDLFIKPQYLEEIFGLHTTFTFYNLLVVLTSEAELPSVKEARRQQMRENIRKIKQEYIADTVLKRKRPFFHFGALNWNLGFNQQLEGPDYNRMNLGMGGLLAGGEFIANLNYSNIQPVDSRNQYYRWRYVNNENKFVRQIAAGKIGPQSIASIYNPVIGLEFTNAPTSIKKSFGTYTLSDYTEPDWVVELYINNVLVDYVKTDASGFYSFNVPLMYGSTNVRLRFYGPWGEEEVSHKYFNIPYMFLPVNQFEYKITGGMVEDEEHNIFAKALFNYGLSRSITLGGGLEYLSTLSAEKELIPFFNTSVKLSPSMLFSGEFAHGVGYKANFNYSSPSRLNLELNYSRYDEEQEAVKFSYLEERKILLSFPMKNNYFFGTSRLRLQQNLMQNHSFTNAEWMFSGRAFGMNMSLRNYAYFTYNADPVVASSLATSFKLKKNLVFSPQMVFNYSESSLSSLRAEVRTSLFENSFLRFSYDRNFTYKQDNVQLSFQYELPFTRLGFSSTASQNRVAFGQQIGGGLSFQPHADHVKFSNSQVLDRGSLKFLPFLDLNGNSEKEDEEPVVSGVTVRTTGGNHKVENPDGTIVFTGLEPHIPHYFEVLTHNLQRISWQVKKASMEIILNPNKMQVVEIPVSVVGEISGFVLLDQNGSSEGVGGININILRNGKLITSLVSQPDGYFSYLGLKTGEYTVQPDPTQLEKLGIKPAKGRPLVINNGKEGALVDNLEFILSNDQN